MAEVAPLEPVEEGNDPEPRSASGADSRNVSMMWAEEYQGALPHPRHFREFENILPGSADRILSMTERQSEHRHEMERALMGGSEKRADRGQFLGAGLLLCGLAGGIWVTLAGQPVAGGILFTASLAAGGLSYVFGDYRPGKDK